MFLRVRPVGDAAITGTGCVQKITLAAAKAAGSDRRLATCMESDRGYDRWWAIPDKLPIPPDYMVVPDRVVGQGSSRSLADNLIGPLTWVAARSASGR